MRQPTPRVSPLPPYWPCWIGSGSLMASDRHPPDRLLENRTALPVTVTATPSEAASTVAKLPLAVEQTVHRLLMKWALRVLRTPAAVQAKDAGEG